MREAKISRILRGDRAWALYCLRGETVELWQDVLTAELRRSRPRKLLVATLKERIPALAIASWAIDDDGMPSSDDPSSPRHVGAPKGNQNASKGDAALDSSFTIRIPQSERDAWMAAKGKRPDGRPASLALWIRRNCNAAAGIPPPEGE